MPQTGCRDQTSEKVLRPVVPIDFLARQLAGAGGAWSALRRRSWMAKYRRRSGRRALPGTRDASPDRSVHSNRRTFGRSGSGYSSSNERATSLSLILPSIASSEAATSCGYKLGTFAPVAGFETAPRSFRRRPGGRFSSRSSSRPEPQSKPGFRRLPRETASIFSRAVSGPDLAFRDGQYARIVRAWVESAGIDGSAYGTHSMRRTKAAQIYKKTGNLRAVQLLLGHTKLESTVRYLGIEVDDALSISEQVEL
jgi:hypothetical protein